MASDLSKAISSTAYSTYEKRLLKEVKSRAVPHHVAIIMDGNRRYASEFGMLISEGHEKGREKLEQILEWCMEIGVKMLTVYAFSTENVSREKEEIDDLMRMFAENFKRLAEDERVHKHKVRVRVLGQKELLTQDSAGTLLHGRVGEKFVNHYTFYAAFATDEEFRIVSGGRTLGSLPVSQALSVGQRILFAGKTWRVEDIDEPQKTIFVVRAGGGTPPLFSGGAGRTHTKVRQRMRQLLEATEVPPYLDEVARRFVAEARANYAGRGLTETFVVDQGSETLLLTWLGDAANEALACLLHRRGFRAGAAGPGVEVLKGQHTTEDILDVLHDAGVDETPPLDVLLADVKNLQREKWDWALPDRLLRKAYASLYLDLDGALEWVRTLPGAGSVRD